MMTKMNKSKKTEKKMKKWKRNNSNNTTAPPSSPPSCTHRIPQSVCHAASASGLRYPFRSPWCECWRKPAHPVWMRAPESTAQWRPRTCSLELVSHGEQNPGSPPLSADAQYAVLSPAPAEERWEEVFTGFVWSKGGVLRLCDVLFVIVLPHNVSWQAYTLPS